MKMFFVCLISFWIGTAIGAVVMGFFAGAKRLREEHDAAVAARLSTMGERHANN